MPLHQNQMAADSKRWILLCQPHRIVESLTIGHQRRGRENAIGVRFYDAGVYVTCEAKVIRVNDEALQR